MSIQSPQNSISFKSRFAKTENLRTVFREIAGWQNSDAGLGEQRKFVHAVKAILNDGQDDIIKVTQEKGQAKLFVNDKEILKDNALSAFYGEAEATRFAIINYAREVLGHKLPNGINDLSEGEANVVQKIVSPVLNSYPTQNNYLFNLKRAYTDAVVELSTFTNKELKKLEELIFN